MSLTTALFSFTLVLALRMRGVGDEALRTSNSEPRAVRWLLFGLLWGLIALSNSTLLIYLPVCGLWIVIPALRKAPGAASVRPRRMGWIIGPIVSAIVLLACIAPWTMRNERVFHAFIPLRGNLGAELYMGNGPSSNGLLMEYFHPFQAPEQLRLYASMGELRYVAMRGAEAKKFIAAKPGHYAADIGRRIYFFWISVPQADAAATVEAGRVLNFASISLAGLLGLALALRNRVPGAGLFAWAIVLLPIPYYLITVAARFRHPLEPLLCIFGVYLFQSAKSSRA
jgi:hypothetical protein